MVTKGRSPIRCPITSVFALVFIMGEHYPSHVKQAAACATRPETLASNQGPTTRGRSPRQSLNPNNDTLSPPRACGGHTYASQGSRRVQM
eukprot:scaffold243536_cov33-Prasinocladus_malaysianus.AAC.2